MQNYKKNSIFIFLNIIFEKNEKMPIENIDEKIKSSQRNIRNNNLQNTPQVPERAASLSRGLQSGVCVLS